MGAPTDNDPDRKAQDDEAPIDDGWTTGSPAHNDRTTHGLYVDPSSVAQLIGGRKAVADHDRTTLGTLEDAVVPVARGTPNPVPVTPALSADHDRTTIEPDVHSAKAVTEDSTIAKLDQTMADLEQSDVRNDQTKAGLGIAQQLAAAAPSSAPAPASRLPAFAVLRTGGGTIPLEKQQELVQPERSPLSFVMRDVDPSAAPQRAHTSGDSSKFASLLGDQPPPPRVDAENPGVTATAMQPVLRRARLRRRWIALGALAATAVLGTALAMQLTTDTPRAAANETAKVTETPAPAAAPGTPTGPVNDGITPPPDEPAPAPTPPPEQVAIATTTPEPETKPADPPPTIAKKRVATKDATPTKSTKKSTTAKKSTKKIATAKKSTTKKKPSTTKKSTTAKKTTKKSSRSQRSGRRRTTN